MTGLQRKTLETGQEELGQRNYKKKLRASYETFLFNLCIMYKISFSLLFFFTALFCLIGYTVWVLCVVFSWRQAGLLISL